MNLIKDLVEAQNAAVAECRAYLDEHGDAEGRLTSAHEAKYQEMFAQVKARGERIQELVEIEKQNEKVESYRAENDLILSPGSSRSNSSKETPKMRKAPAFVRNATMKMSDEETFLRDFARGREGNELNLDFSGLAHEVDNRGRLQVFNLDTTTGSSGMVFTDIAKSLYEHLVESNKVFGLATVVNTADGNSIKFPRTTARGTAEIVPEGSAIPDGEGGFSALTLDSYKYASWTEVTNELLEDVSFNLSGYIGRDAGRAIGKASGAHMVTGDGSGKPRGLISAVANDVGTAVAIGSATIESDNLIDAFYSVDDPYRENASWLLNSSTAKAIRKLKNADDRYVWSDGLNGAPAEILGRPVIVDPAVASIGSANLSVYFGDINQTYIARTGGVKLMRSDHHLAKNDKVAFRATARMDADLIDGTSNSAAVVDTD